MSRIRRNASLFGALTGLALFAGAAIAAEDTAIEIETGKSGPKIERDIFGQFAEHLGSGIYGGIWVGKDSPIPNVRGIRSDVVAALKAIKVPVVRWPGGCFADEYHWRNGIGPAAKRPATLNGNWGNVIEPNSFGSHEYFDFLDQIGAEAYLSVNVGSGSPEEAADWLEYLTATSPTTLAKQRAANGHPAPYRIKYLGLGNENWGCGGSMRPVTDRRSGAAGAHTSPSASGERSARTTRRTAPPGPTCLTTTPGRVPTAGARTAFSGSRTTPPDCVSPWRCGTSGTRS